MKQNNIPKLILILLILFVGTKTFSQSKPYVETEYSKTENGSIGQENYSFNLRNGTLTIVDKDTSRYDKYGPLAFSESGFNGEGFYYELYKPDIKGNPLAFTRGKELRGYVFIYDKKKGSLLFIDEMKIVNKSKKTKTYYTQDGYEKTNSSSSKISDNVIRADFDIRDVIINSETLSKLMGRINFAFEQNGNKETSDDGNFVTVQYENDSNVRPIVTYLTNGETHQIVFLVPKYDADNLVKELISKYGTEKIEGEEIIKRENLIYDYRSDGDVGIIVIRK